ncbi:MULTISPECIES: DUF1761 domain-containing protein [Erythrobacter]|jgi:hypothetical protein|uniref:DUF1761 domain-containing protein n=1 Tax=Erythrobacter aureus TaxID=2182384 RepID=A0A345YD28_9SPHN|nr:MULTISPECIES: DUF1761 domain-containing protein [Erythrobacter]AXK41830.1 DUF1761 domain-containing protein [Erythrobacter aureus]MCF8883599.1 DUF1761 domain-containing protein [Erythrobacter sp. SN021]
MGEINWLPVLLGALAFFLVGAIWYGVLFSKAWQKAAGISDEQLQGGNMALIFGLTFLAEVVIAMTLWHLIVRTGASDRAVMMMAIGFGATIMTPAIGINYLYLRKTLAHFLIDAGHFIVGMAAMGGVFLYFR